MSKSPIKFESIPTSNTSNTDAKSSSKYIPKPLDSWENINIINKWTFSFANNMLDNGLNKPLQHDDLIALPVRDEVDHICDILEQCYIKSKSISILPRLMIALIWSRWYDITIMILWALAEGAVRIGSPVVIRILLLCLADTNKKKEAYIWAGVLGALGIIQAVIHHILFFYSMRLGWNWKNSTTAMVYKKLFKIKGNSLTSANIDMGTMVNYISNDVGRFEDFSTFASFFFVSFLEVIAILIILIYQLNVASGFAGVGITLLLIPIQMKLAQRFASQRSKTAKSTDKRVRFIKEVIDGIATVKSYGWNVPFFSFIQNFRKEETKTIAESQLLRAFNLALYSFGPPAAQFVTFVVFFKTGGTLTLPIVFSTISLLQALRCSMGRQWARSVETGSEAITSCNRIEHFLNLHESASDNANEESTNSTDSTDANGIELKALKLDMDCYLDIKKSSFSYSDDKDNNYFASLKGINFSVQKGELLIVVGPVGSGKSSLLSAILGEMTLMEGKIGLQKGLRLSYCSQRPWILASSVYNNIILAGDDGNDGECDKNEGIDFDFLNPKYVNEPLYKLAVENCQLIPDFLEWPDYDMTMIGERGVSVSGGQKARISIARAVYSNSNLNLLDDPLSACDAKVGSALFFDGIVGQLKNRGKSVVLATHQLQYLPFADKLLVLDNDGTQAFFGTFIELKEKIGKDPNRAFDFLKATNLFSDDLNTSNIVESNNDDDETSVIKDKTYDKSINIEKRRRLNELKEIISEEDRIEGKVSLNLIWTYLKSGGGLSAFVAIFMAIASQVLLMMTDYWLKWWASGNYFGSQADIRYIWIFAILVFFCIILSYYRAVVWFQYTLKSASSLHERILWSILHAPLHFFIANPTGRILNRFAKDQNITDEALPVTLFDFIQCFLFCLSSLILVCVSIPWLILIIPPLLFAFMKVRHKFVASQREIKRLEAISRSPIYSNFTSTLDGISSLRAYKLERRATKSFQDQINKNARSWFSFLISSRWLGFRLDFQCASILIAISIVAVILQDSIDVGLLGFALVYTMSLSGLLQWTVRQSAEVEAQLVSVERIESYCNLPAEPGYSTTSLDSIKPRSRSLSLLYDPTKSRSRSMSSVVDTSAKDSGANKPVGQLCLHNLHIKYRHDLEHVVSQLSLEITAGSKVGIIGRTGAGKSTILQSLLRLNLITEGNIYLDGESILEMSLENARAQITVIPQEPHLFSGTVRFNLDPFNIYNDQEIWNALKNAHIHEALSKELGLLTVVDEGGKNFSQGERQLLSMARAILRKSKVVLMDEVTSSIDYATDKLIQTTIRTCPELRSATILTIAHRLRTIADADLIVVLGPGGKLLEKGKPYDLLVSETSHFKALAIESQEMDDLLEIARKANE